MAGLIKGVMQRVENKDMRFGSSPEYVAVKVDSRGLGNQEEVLLLTDAELEVLRVRADKCPKTIKAHKTGWLRDLLD